MVPFGEGSVNLLSLIIILGTVLGFILACYLFFTKSEKNGANKLLSIIVLQFTLIIFPSFTYIMGIMDDLPHFIKLYVITGFMVGPFSYFYVIKCTQKGFKILPILYLHFIPAIVDLIYHIPFYSLGGEEKITYFFSFYENGRLTEPPLLSLLKMIHLLSYSFVSIRLIFKYRKHIDNTASYIDEAYHRWLLVFCFSMLYPIIAATIFIITGKLTIGTTIIISSPTVFIFSVFTLVLIKPEIFQKFPHQMLMTESTEQQTQKYENSNLQEIQKERYVKKLINQIETQKPFREPELTLAQLAEQVNIPAHHLSQVINEKLNCNFLDFINGYRIEDAKEKLVDDAYSHYTVIAIAYEVGFNSKTAFYSAFKKQTGTTPSNFRKQLKAS